MTWAAIDDNMPTNHKVLSVPVGARYLYVVGLCYCAKELSDGHIPDTALPILVATAGVPKRAVADLVDAGLWTRNGVGHVVPDWLEFNPSREEVIEKRTRAAERKARWREKQKGKRDATRDKTRDATDAERGRDAPPQPLPNPEGKLGRGGASEDPPPTCQACNDRGWIIPADRTEAIPCDHSTVIDDEPAPPTPELRSIL